MEKQIFTSEVTMHFNIRNNKEGKPSAIYMVIRYQGIQYKIPTHLKIMREHWRKDNAMISSCLSELDNKNNKIVNKNLLEYKVKYLSLIDRMGEEPDTPFNDLLSSVFDITKKKEKRELVIAAMNQAVINDNNIKESSKITYYNVINDFRDFNKNIFIDELNVNIVNDFIKFLGSKKVTHKITKERVYVEDNQVFREMKNFYILLNKIQLTHTDYDFSSIDKLKKAIKKDKETEENTVALYDSEIEQILNIDLNGSLDIARDLFIFQTELGQRISDILLLTKKDLRNDITSSNNINIRQKKTGTCVCIPLSDTALKILNKYDYILPYLNSDTININIKEICRLCGINEKIKCSEKRGGKKYEYEVEKWRLVSTHTARRSFVTNAIYNNIDESLIKKVTGHSTSTSFAKYDRLHGELAADAFRKAKAKR